MKFTRRNFIKTTGTSVIASGLTTYAFGSRSINSANTPDSFRLAIAGYTFAKINLGQSLVMMKEVGTCRGIIDFPKYFRTLRKERYTGTCSLEYGKDMVDPLPGIAESTGYFRGVMAGLQ